MINQLNPSFTPASTTSSDPKSFWTAASDPLAAILRNVKGRNRREMIRDYYEAGKLDQLSDELLMDSLSDKERASLGKIT